MSLLSLDQRQQGCINPWISHTHSRCLTATASPLTWLQVGTAGGCVHGEGMAHVAVSGSRSRPAMHSNKAFEHVTSRQCHQCPEGNHDKVERQWWKVLQPQAQQYLQQQSSPSVYFWQTVIIRKIKLKNKQTRVSQDAVNIILLKANRIVYILYLQVVQ